jgi:hypothetical protein
VKKKPSKEDLEAAFNYLCLQLPTPMASKAVNQAKHIRAIQRVAKDVLRASRLPLPLADERHVAADWKRIRKRKALSPVILIQGDLSKEHSAIIATGYHRMCAACHADEDAPVASWCRRAEVAAYDTPSAGAAERKMLGPCDGPPFPNARGQPQVSAYGPYK